jgi:hypothetical protein
MFHPEWLAILVLVKKKNSKWRMCVDYTGLSKACPKNPFPLPRIDQIVDSTSGCEALSFLDAYSDYYNTQGVCHQLSSGFELKHDRLSGDDDVKVNLWRWA